MHYINALKWHFHPIKQSCPFCVSVIIIIIFLFMFKDVSFFPVSARNCTNMINLSGQIGTNMCETVSCLNKSEAHTVPYQTYCLVNMQMLFLAEVHDSTHSYDGQLFGLVVSFATVLDCVKNISRFFFFCYCCRFFEKCFPFSLYLQY